jgi:hypothetical protein
MNHPRVNLLKKSERRYQGAVSRRFMLVSIVVTPILFIAVLSGVKLIQYGGIRAELAAGREIWRGLEGRLAVAQEQQRGLKTNREAIALLDGWKASQVPMQGLLLDIQQVIPENVQLTRISVRGQSGTSLYRTAEDLGLKYRLTVQGISQGSEAEDSVIQLRKDLLSGGNMASIFDSVNLISMRKRSGIDGENLREFGLEGLAADSGAGE